MKVKQKLIIIKNLILLELLLATACVSFAAPIPEDVKKVIVFLYYPNEITNASPDGTGFMVSLVGESNTNIAFGYLVTARHVLRPENNWLKSVVVRINRRDGTADNITLPLVASGPNPNVFTHSDPSVDIAVVPFFPQPFTNYDCLTLPINMVTSETDFKELGIREGSDVFFSGMFSHHLGEKRNTPITRFGKVALITDDKIDWLWGKTDLYLMEANSYPGNSGSPVFFQFGMERGNSIIIGTGQDIKLAGIMSGTYNDVQPLQTVSVSTNQYVTPNLGICGVVPAYKLKEILLSKELRELRERRLKLAVTK